LCKIGKNTVTWGDKKSELMKTKSTVLELDLHGVLHSKVEDRLYDFFFWQNNDEGVIITGNSTDMKNIVTRWLDYNGFDYYINPSNMGRINVVMSNL